MMNETITAHRWTFPTDAGMATVVFRPNETPCPHEKCTSYFVTIFSPRGRRFRLRYLWHAESYPGRGDAADILAYLVNNPDWFEELES